MYQYAHLCRWWRGSSTCTTSSRGSSTWSPTGEDLANPIFISGKNKQSLSTSMFRADIKEVVVLVVHTTTGRRTQNYHFFMLPNEIWFTSIYPAICLFIYVSIYIYTSIYLSMFLYIHQSSQLSINLYIYLISIRPRRATWRLESFYDIERYAEFAAVDDNPYQYYPTGQVMQDQVRLRQFRSHWPLLLTTTGNDRSGL